MNKHLIRQALYEDVVNKLKEHSKNYVILSVSYYNNTKFLAKIIQMAAWFKNRPKIAHTAAIYKFGVDPRLVEATTCGVNHCGLYDAYFSGQFKGEVTAHVLKAKQTSRKRLELSNYIEHKILGKKYSVLKAIRSFIDIGKDQKDDPDIYYCTDLIIDLYEKITHSSCHFVENNAEITPAQLFEILTDRELERFTVIDTEKL